MKVEEDIREKIEQAWWEIDAKTKASRKLMPSPKEHKNLLGDKEKYLLAILNLKCNGFSLETLIELAGMVKKDECLGVVNMNAELPNNPYKRKPRVEGYDLDYSPDLDVAGFFTQQAMLQANFKQVTLCIYKGNDGQA